MDSDSDYPDSPASTVELDSVCPPSSLTSSPESSPPSSPSSSPPLLSPPSSPMVVADPRDELLAVFTAVRNGDPVELSRLLFRSPSSSFNINWLDKQSGQSALHQSCQDGNLPLVKLLMEFGADMRLTNRDGWSALHLAAYAGHRDVTLYLLSLSSRGGSTTPSR